MVELLPPCPAPTPTPVFLSGEFCGQRSLAGYTQSMGLQRCIRLSNCRFLPIDGTRRAAAVVPFSHVKAVVKWSWLFLLPEVRLL